ncbi:MAG: hypothetical protein QM764_16220 [Chitinophagaceae bacterium]
MKTVSEKISSISAYPLKALNLSEDEYQSELKLWEHTNTVSSGDIRVLPMVNPYRAKDFLENNDRVASNDNLV